MINSFIYMIIALMKELKERLVFARHFAGKTQKEVAEAVGIAQPTYQALEKGKSRKSAYIAKIAKVLSVNPYWLETGSGSMESAVDDDAVISYVMSLDPDRRLALWSRVAARMGEDVQKK